MKQNNLLCWNLPYLITALFFSGCATEHDTMSSSASEPHRASTRVYEMRTYHVAPGKMEALHARFRNHTQRLFNKHGIGEVGYWVPMDQSDQRLVFILDYPNREVREKAWKAFMDDPDWQAAYKASEAQGKLVEKVDQVFMQLTDYSPRPRGKRANPSRVFEQRTYTASPGNLSHLNARFRDHTLKLFSRHGMGHVGYWTPMPDQKGSQDTLIYILAHANHNAADASFKAFREDPAWVEARKASEVKAGGSLTAQDGVKSVFLVPTDYSPIR